MNSRTNTQVVGLAAGVTTLLLWLVGFFLPEFMATAPTGVEAALTGVIAVITGFLVNPEAGIK